MQRRKGDFLAEEAARPWRGNGAAPKPPKPQACCGVLVRSAQGGWQQGRRPVCPWALPPTACLPASIPRPSKMAARTEGPRVGGFLRGIWHEVAEKLGKWLRGKFPAPSAASAVTLCPVPHPALPSCSP